MKSGVRVALLAVALTVAAVSLVATPAVADDDEDVGIATGDGINSTIDLEASGNYSGQSGAGVLDCEGQPTHHDCEKGGGAGTEAGSVDYTGDTYGDDDDLRGGGGDEVTVAGQGEQATFEFDCDLTTSPSQDDCTVNVTSSQGDAPGPLGERDGEFDNDDDEPGDERSEEGEENGEDDDNRNANAE